MSTTEIGIGGNREYKDTLFRKIFGTVEPYMNMRILCKWSVTIRKSIKIQKRRLRMLCKKLLIKIIWMDILTESRKSRISSV